MKRGLSIPNMGEGPELVRLAVQAERAGFDGAFLWDHTVGTPDFAVPLADPWSLLGAIAVQTSSIRIGTTVAALPRRQVQEVARQAVTLDHLSGGRMVLGVGLGEPPSEYVAIGRRPDRRELAARLDESLEVLARLWTGEPVDHEGAHVTLRGAQFLPVPVQRPRVPVWCSCMVPNDRTLGRAARWDGAIIGEMGPEGAMLPPDPAKVAAVTRALHGSGTEATRSDVVVAVPPNLDDADAAAYAEAGAAWLLTTGDVEELAALVDG